MAKDAFYFSHDMNARSDIKIMAMRSVYGSEGYGWFWIIIELMRAEESYKIRVNQKYSYHALAKEMDTTPETAKSFIDDCIHEFELFQADDEFIWSNSLLNRLENMELLKQKRVQAGKKGGQNKAINQTSSKILANDKQTSSKSLANPSTKLNETKLNNTKLNTLTSLDDAVAYYSNNIGLITPIIADKINAWTNDLSDEVIKLAIDISVEQNTRKWAYVEAILKEWHERGANTVDDCKALQLEFKSRKSRSGKKIKPVIEMAVSTENISDDEYQRILDKYGVEVQPC